MSDSKASDRDVNRAIRSWLHEDRHDDASRIAGAVLDRVEATSRRRAGWPAWRTPTMNKFLSIGVGGLAAVAAILLVGSQLFGSPAPGPGGPGATPTPTREATATPEPSPVGDGSLPEGRHDLWRGDLGVTISVTIPAPGWHGDPEGGILTKDENIAAPDGAGLIVFADTNDLLVGLGDVYIYGDPCHWESTKPDTPVTTVDEAIAALAAQASRAASDLGDIMLDGHVGKRITLQVPDDAVFSDCDGGEFRTLVEGEDSARFHQDPGQIDLFWVLDVNGELVIFDMGYYEGTPERVLDEVASIVESARLSYSP